MNPGAHLDMWGVDVACVVLLVGYQLNPILFVGNHVTETVALCVFGQSCCGDNTVGPLLGNLLVLCENTLLFQLQLQGLTLERWREKQKERRGCSVSFTFHCTWETIQTRNVIIICTRISKLWCRSQYSAVNGDQSTYQQFNRAQSAGVLCILVCDYEASRVCFSLFFYHSFNLARSPSLSGHILNIPTGLEAISTTMPCVPQPT